MAKYEKLWMNPILQLMILSEDHMIRSVRVKKNIDQRPIVSKLMFF